MSYPDEQDQNFPAARKGSSGGDAGFGGLNPAGDQWSAPLSPDHNPGWDSGSSVPVGPYADNGGYPPSTPYRPGPVPGYAPPPPVGPRVGQTSPQGRRRRGVAIIFAFIAVLLAGTLSALLFLRTNDGSTNNQGNGPGLAVATDTLVPTPTLKPGQTPLPTRVPTQVPPTPLPGQPTATPIPFANSAAVSFTAASHGISSARPTLTASTSGGDISATVINANVAVGDTQSPNFDAPQTGFGQEDSGTITITNHTGATQNPPSGVSVTSQTSDPQGGLITCTTSYISGVTKSPLANGQFTTVACTVPKNEAEPASTYNFTNNSWNYSGTVGAGGAPLQYTVPGNCATDPNSLNPAESAAKSKLSADLQGNLPGGTTVFSPPSYNYSNATCSPTANTQRTSEFQYSVSVAGTGAETYYNNGDVQAFEAQQLQAAANNYPPGGSWQLSAGHNQVCSGGGSTSGASTTSVTISCPASSLAVWIWSSSAAHSAFDSLITGQPKQTAISAINAVQGVASGSASISLSGGSYVPQNGSAISYSIKTP